MHHHNHQLLFLNNSLQLMLHTRIQRAEGDESPDGQLAVEFLDDYCVLLKSHHVFPLKGFSKISVSTSLKYMMPQEWMRHPCLRERDPRTGLYKPLSEGWVRFLSFFSQPVLRIYDVFIPVDKPAQTPLPESPFLFLKMHAMKSILMFPYESQHDTEVRAYKLAHTFHPQVSQREGQQGQPYQRFLVHFVIIAWS